MPIKTPGSGGIKQEPAKIKVFEQSLGAFDTNQTPTQPVPPFLFTSSSPWRPGFPLGGPH